LSVEKHIKERILKEVMVNLVWFKDIDKSKADLVGEKGADLGELYNQDFNIPSGFVITTEAFKEFLGVHGIEIKINGILSKVNRENPKEVETASEEIKKLIVDEDMSPGLKGEILEAYENLNVDAELLNAGGDVLNLIKNGRGNAIVAVRASVNSKNLNQDNFLNIRSKDKLIETVKKSWMSLYNPGSLVFEKENNLMAVVIQKMVDVVKSGVVFGINPVSKDKEEVLIEAGFGWGESLSKGKINPDLYVIDKKSLNIKKENIEKKKIKIMKDLNTGETVNKKIFEEEQGKRVLENFEIDELLKLSEEIEEHYGEAREIEFGYDRRLHVLGTKALDLSENEEEDLKGEILLKGKGVSAGVGVGRVRVVRNKDHMERFEEGEVLVIEYFEDYMWPLLKKAKAMVVGFGGISSNFANGEIKVPIVVSEDCMAELNEGLIVTVDGTKGIIYGGEANKKVDIIDTGNSSPVPQQKNDNSSGLM